MLRKLKTTGVRPEIRITIGKKMRQARVDAGATQGDIAAELEITRQTVIDWERDHRRPNKASVFAWAHLTGVDSEWLLDDEDQRPYPPHDTADNGSADGGFPLRRKDRVFRLGGMPCNQPASSETPRDDAA